MRLYGKKSTEEEIAREISRLLLGDQDRREGPISVTDAARTLGYTRATVYNYVKKAVEKYHMLEYKNGRICLPENSKQLMKFRRFDKKHDITQDPLVSDWKQDLLTRKNGEPLTTWKTRILALESVCNTCKVNPRELVISQRQTEKILKNYSQLYREGRVDKRPAGKKMISSDIKNVVYQKVQGVRDFCGFYNMTWRRGVGGIMSQKVPSHGKYADIRLDDNELEQADKFIKEKWGLDSDVYRWFWIGIESCSRFEALYSTNLEHTRHAGKTGKTTYIMTAFESKTKQIKNGKWIKYITRPDTQKSIDFLKARNGTRIYESKMPKFAFRNEINQALKEIYNHLGKKNYFEDHPTHALRHVGAHYWLAKKNYNYGLVAVIGGWNTIDELRKSYGEMPPEKVLEMIEGDYKESQVQLLH
jgi:hypothetical protein